MEETNELASLHNDSAARDHATSPTRINRKWLVVAAAVLIAAAVATYIFWPQHSARTDGVMTEVKVPAKPNDAAPGEPKEKDVVVADSDELKEITVEPVTERTVALDRDTTGKVGFNEDRQTSVFTPYAGRAVQVLVNKGDTVRAGQPLIIVETPDLVAAQNDLSAARADLDKAKIGLQIAETAADRARRLQAQEALATKDLQQAEAELQRAQEEQRRAQAAVAVVESRLALFGKTKEEIANFGARAASSIDNRIVIRAPISGTILDRKVGVGQYLKPDAPDPLMLIADLSSVWVMADVYESYLPQIHVGAPVRIRVAAYPDRALPARISFINPTVDPATRTVHVRCTVPNPNGVLKPEMFAKIDIDATAPAPVRLVPTSALVSQGPDSFLFVEESTGRFRRRQVHPQRELDGKTVIDELKPGERVATHGVMLLNMQIK